MLSENMKQEYRLVQGIDLTDFNTVVNSYMTQGWECQGGIATVQAPAGTKYLQALVKTTIVNLL